MLWNNSVTHFYQKLIIFVWDRTEDSLAFLLTYTSVGICFQQLLKQIQGNCKLKKQTITTTTKQGIQKV